MSQIIIHNAETQETIIRDMTPEEINPSLTWTDEQKAQAETRAQSKANAEASKAALLEKLGITEEEAKLLLS